jgi:hypothetical protein
MKLYARRSAYLWKLSSMSWTRDVYCAGSISAGTPGE